MHSYSLAAFHYQRSLQILADTGGFIPFVMETLTALSELWSTQGNREKVVELLTFVAYHPQSAPGERANAEEMLLQLQSEMLPAAFVNAQERGRSLELWQVVREQIAELDRLIQTLAPTTPLTLSPSFSGPLTVRELEILRLI